MKSQRIVAALLVAASMAAACSGATSHAASTSPGPASSGPPTASERLYGLGPSPAPASKVDYQPDVVVVGGGPSSVRAATADGLTWTLDPSAPHVNALAIGKVMLLTDEATGRIIALDRTTAGVVVTLAPVPLGEVFKNARLSFTTPITSDMLVIDPVPTSGGDAEILPPGVPLGSGTATPSVNTPGGASATTPTTSGAAAAPGGAPRVATAGLVQLAGAPCPSTTLASTTSTTVCGGGSGSGGGMTPPATSPPSSTPPSSTPDTTAPSSPSSLPSGSGGGAPASGGSPTSAPSAGVGGLSGGLFGEAGGSYGGSTGFGPVPADPCGPAGGAAPAPAVSAVQPFVNTNGPTLSPAYEVTAGAWAFEVERLPGQLTFRASLGGKSLRLGLVFRVFFSHLSFSGTDTIHDGVETPSGIHLDGIDRIQVGLTGGSGAGLADDVRLRIDVPINFKFLTRQTLIADVPVVFAAKPKFIVETAFSVKNSTLSTCGDYNVNIQPKGPIDAPVMALFQATRSMLPIGGVSIGVNAMVVAFELKFMAGIGLKVAYAGPFATFDVAVGITRGSDIGIVNCQSGDLVISAKTGVGLSLDGGAAKYLGEGAQKLAAAGKAASSAKLAALSSKLLKYDGNSIDFDLALYAGTIYTAHKAIPDVPLCGGGK